MSDLDLPALAARYRISDATGLTEELASRLPVRFVFDGSPSHPLAFGWSIKDGVHVLRCHPFDDEQASLLLVGRFVACIDLYEAVRRRVSHMREVAFNFDDGGVGPGLSFCSNRADSHLVPDCFWLESRAYPVLEELYLANMPAWKERHERLLWRGSATGVPKGGELIPRLRLCAMTRDEPDCDIGITEHWGLYPEVPRASWVHTHDYCRYRFHVDIDGGTNAWNGLFFKLLSGGVVFKVASRDGFRQWYYDRLEPWVHYIPVRTDMSDLLSVYRRLREDDVAAERIGMAGREFALSLNYEQEVEKAAKTIINIGKAD